MDDREKLEWLMSHRVDIIPINDGEWYTIRLIFPEYRLQTDWHETLDGAILDAKQLYNSIENARHISRKR